MSIDDNVEEENGIVTLTLLPGENYVIDESHKSASINVIDNDVNQSTDEELPEVYFNFNSFDKVEGQRIYFGITTTGASIYRPINVNIKLFQSSNGGNYISDSMTRIVTLNREERSKTFYINTVDDQIDEPNGRVYAKIESGTGYKIRDRRKY